MRFENAAPRRFDLGVGADGLHSQVRRLVFGDESRRLHNAMAVDDYPPSPTASEAGPAPRASPAAESGWSERHTATLRGSTKLNLRPGVVHTPVPHDSY